MKLDRNREKEIVQQLQNAIDAIQTEIEANWDRFSNGQNITISEARKMANKMDVKRFERKAKEYVKNKDFSPQANKELKIYNLVMRVSRLELLKSQIGLELITLFDELDKWGYSQLTEAAKEEYLRQAEPFKKIIRLRLEKLLMHHSNQVNSLRLVITFGKILLK